MTLAMVAGASAADLYVKAPPPFSWTGCYVGVAGGGAWGQGTQVNSNGLSITGGDLNISGGIVGGTVGCNYQLASSWVIGIEDDFSWTNKQGSSNDSAANGFNSTFNSQTHETWIDTLRGRLGFVVPGGALLYATGGAAFANAGITVCSTPGAGQVCATEDHSRTGWTAGGGIEWWIPNSKVSVKAEYLYADFGSQAYFTPPPTTAAFANRTGGVTLNDNIVRAGLNWHF